jgi:hypothetical protein
MFDSGASVLGGVQKSVVDGLLGILTVRVAGGRPEDVDREAGVAGSCDHRVRRNCPYRRRARLCCTFGERYLELCDEGATGHEYRALHELIRHYTVADIDPLFEMI